MAVESVGDNDERRYMRKALADAARHFDLRLLGGATFGWRDRTIGAAARGRAGRFWLRLTSEATAWVGGHLWDGNIAANQIRGLPKSEVIKSQDWSSGDRCTRAEVMTFIDHAVVSTTPNLREDPNSPESWWAALANALDVIGQVQTKRVFLSQDAVTATLTEFFPAQINPVVDTWVPAHGDLNWSNVTGPELYVLDWEGWGTAPAGYDVATLYCRSLLVPKIADRIRRDYAEILNTPDGIRSQLLLAARIRSAAHIDPALAKPVDDLTQQLLLQ